MQDIVGHVALHNALQPPSSTGMQSTFLAMSHTLLGGLAFWGATWRLQGILEYNTIAMVYKEGHSGKHLRNSALTLCLCNAPSLDHGPDHSSWQELHPCYLSTVLFKSASLLSVIFMTASFQLTPGLFHHCFAFSILPARMLICFLSCFVWMRFKILSQMRSLGQVHFYDVL